MKKTVLQTKGLDVEVLEEAAANVEGQGLDSLHSYIRYIVRQAAKGVIFYNASWGDAVDSEVRKSFDNIKSGEYFSIEEKDEVGAALRKSMRKLDVEDNA